MKSSYNENDGDRMLSHANVSSKALELLFSSYCALVE